MTPTVRRRITGGLVAVIVVISCIFLGRWQWHRHEARSAQVNQITANYGKPPAAFSDLVTQPDAQLPSDLEWRSVELTGQFEEPILKIRNRPVDGKHGFHIAQPFVFDDHTVLVNRGFVEIQDPAAIDFPAQSGGEVSLIGRLRPAEPADSRSAPAGQGFTFNPAQLLPNDPNLVTGTYLVASEQNPPADNQISPLPAPDTDLGSHFSYALQWWFFAGGAVVAFFLLIRRENQHEGARPTSTRKKRASSAEAEEDALIAAWEQQQ